MPISPSWTYREIHATWRNPFTDLLERGSYVAELKQRTVNTLSDGSKQIFRSYKLGSGPLATVEGQPSLTLSLPVIDDPDNLPQGGEILLTVTFDAGGSEIFHLSPLTIWPIGDYTIVGGGYDLALILDPTNVPAAPAVAVIGVPNGVAKLNSVGLVVNADGSLPAGGGGGGSSITAYADVVALPNYPATFPPVIGTTSTTAKRGDYAPAATDISDASSIGRAVLVATTQAAARTAIGAVTVGTLSTDAKAGNYQPASTNISDATTTGRSVLTAASATAARTAIGFDAAARADAPSPAAMKWDTNTHTWWALDPATNTYVDGGPRPANLAPGACVYDSRNDPAMVLPTGTQAPLPLTPNGKTGDEFKLHQNDSHWP